MHAGGERGVELDVIGLRFGDEPETGVRGAHVVQGELDAGAAQPAHDAPKVEKVADPGAFRELEHHPTGKLPQVAVAHEVGIEDGDRIHVQEQQAARRESGHAGQRRFPREPFQLPGEPGLGREREQVLRALERPARAAGIGLVAEDATALQVDDRLEYRRELPRVDDVLQRRAGLLQLPVALGEGVGVGGVERPEDEPVERGAGIAGNSGASDEAFELARQALRKRVADLLDHALAHALAKAVHLLVGHDVRIPRRRQDQDEAVPAHRQLGEEVVLAEPLLLGLRQLPGHRPDDLVEGLPPEQVFQPGQRAHVQGQERDVGALAQDAVNLPQQQGQRWQLGQLVEQRFRYIALGLGPVLQDLSQDPKLQLGRRGAASLAGIRRVLTFILMVQVGVHGLAQFCKSPRSPPAQGSGGVAGPDRRRARGGQVGGSHGCGRGGVGGDGGGRRRRVSAGRPPRSCGSRRRPAG